MKKRVLLIDESLTVQKVVSLTLDKSRYHVAFAKTRAEAMKLIVEQPPDLILVSDQVSDITASSFPKELETWLGGIREVAPVILITGQDIREQKHYAAVLKKPFLPATLQELADRFIRTKETPISSENSSADDFEDQRLQKIFNDTFADEAQLVKETFRDDMETVEEVPAPRPTRSTPPPPGPTRSGSLWDSAPAPASAADNKAALWSEEETPKEETPRMETHVIQEKDLERNLKDHNLDEVVDKVLSRIVPPIVERLVQERLDKLMKEQEQFIELKP